MFEAGWVTALIAVGCGIAGVGILCWRRPRLRGTTLVAPWNWALVSLSSLVVAEVAVGSTAVAEDEPTWTAALRFVAAVSTFCPAIAVLGAKRPQDRAWKFIVLSMWVMVSLPAAEGLLLRPGQALQIHGLVSWFLLLLIGLGVLNNLPTRFGLAGCLYGLGQGCLLCEHLPVIHTSGGTWLVMLGLVLSVLAGGLAAIQWPARGAEVLPLDRVWLDFRDLFGALWGLRVAERVNAAAGMHGWKLQLGWWGFQTESGAPMTPEVTRQVHNNLQNLLRRFVSADWMELRLSEPMTRAPEDADV